MNRPGLEQAAVIVAALCLASPAAASNFGDFPSILPILAFTPFACAGVGFFASLKKTDEGRPDGIDGKRFVVASLIALPIWLVICLAAFLATL